MVESRSAAILSSGSVVDSRDTIITMQDPSRRVLRNRPAGDDAELHTLELHGREREYLLHVPPAHDSSTPAPLVLSLHGAGGTHTLSRDSTAWSAKADAEGFLVAYPEAVRTHADKPVSFINNPTFWNVGQGGLAEKLGVSDVDFLATLIQTIGREHAIDTRRVYVSGFSNGAAMAMRFAIERSDLVAAACAVAGHLWIREQQPQHPVSLIYIAGDSDPLSPWDGGTFTTPWGRPFTSPPVRETIDRWASWIESTIRFDMPRDDGVTFTRYGPDARAREVQIYKIAGCGHVWPGGPPVLAERITGPSTDKLAATDVVWDFFRKHPKLG